MFNQTLWNGGLWNSSGAAISIPAEGTIYPPFIASTSQVFAPVIAVLTIVDAGVSFTMSDERVLSFSITDEAGGNE